MAFQRQNWQNNESGILRKKDEKEEELLVFGYSCKLFRDDDKALYIDQGKHLIPWMGDESLRIDRYDVRGALYDLSKYEAISGKQEELYWINLSNDERRIEQLCDEERYRALIHNEDEEALYQEEEIKRLHRALESDKTYGQVSYSYEDENGEASSKPVEDGNQIEEQDEPFVPPPELDLPQGTVVPDTVKLNAIIEKTAMFITQQGSQMEIILKMKQASNPQFEFLSYNSTLHGYYRHILMAIKTGRYRPKIQANTEENKLDEENGSDQNYYLHHSLSQGPSSTFNVAPSIPSINYKPSSDCAYSMLVNKIRGNQSKFNELSKTTDTAKESVTDRDKATGTVLSEEQIIAKASIMSSPKMYNQPEVLDGYDAEGNKSDNVNRHLTPPSITQRSGRRKRRKRQQGGFAYNDYDEETVDVPSYDNRLQDMENEFDHQPNIQLESVQPTTMMPPTDVQLIIDKMASYVAKNGRDFEVIVRSKNDPRFYFLEIFNVYYPYYCSKVEEFELMNKPSERFATEDSNTMENNDLETQNSIRSSDNSKDNSANENTKSGQKPNPVCFSIKRPKESEGLEIKSALPVEESSDEEECEDGGNDKEENDNKSNKQNDVYDPVEVVSEDEINSSVKSPEDNKLIVPREKLTEERAKDKLVSVVKEKFVSKDKEKQLQLIRKRRAAAFINSLQKTKKSSVSPDKSLMTMIGPQLPDNLKSDEVSESGEVSDNDDNNSNSVTSPPSSVTSPDVTIIEDTKINVENSKDKDSKTKDSLSLFEKLKSSKYSYFDKSDRRNRDSLDNRHKHRKRKRSRSPIHRHYSSHSSRPHSYHISHTSNREAKHRKHHRHRKERHRSDRDYNISSGSHRSRHKHYKSKKHKKKDDKKYSGSSGSESG